MEISIITTYLLFTLSLHYSKYQTMAVIRLCTSYCDTPRRAITQTKHETNHHHYLFTYYNDFSFFWVSNKGMDKILNTLLCYPRIAITQTKHERNNHHYLLTFHSSCAFFLGSKQCINKILHTLLWYPMQSITQTKHGHKHHHYLFPFHNDFALF